jgi:hypothetical protein
MLNAGVAFVCFDVKVSKELPPFALYNLQISFVAKKNKM